MSRKQFVANQARLLPAVDVLDLYGNVAIVTGCNSGIDFEIVQYYLQHNIKHIIAACRSEHKTCIAINKVLAETKHEQEAIRFKALDLLLFLDSVQQFADRFMASTP